MRRIDERPRTSKSTKLSIERRDQRVRHRMGEPHQVAVGARRIDHDQVMGRSTDAMASAKPKNSIASFSTSRQLLARAMQKCVGTLSRGPLDPPRRGDARCNA